MPNKFSDFNNRVSNYVLDNGRLDDLLSAIGVTGLAKKGAYLRGDCPICDAEDFYVWVNRDRHMSIYWFCEKRCHDRCVSSLLGLARGMLAKRAGTTPKGVKMEEAMTYLDDHARPPRDGQAGVALAHDDAGGLFGLDGARANLHPKGLLFLVATAAEAQRVIDAGYPAVAYAAGLTGGQAALVSRLARRLMVVSPEGHDAQRAAYAVEHALQQADAMPIPCRLPTPLADTSAEELKDALDEWTTEVFPDE